jgi:hypothetical protein
MSAIKLLFRGTTAAAMLCVLALLDPAAVVPAAATATPAWSVVPSPNAMAPQGQFGGVSCVSATACVAVGSSVSRAGTKAALAERWNGRAWTIQRVPSPFGAVGTSLSAVSCTSAAACTAVGYYETSAVNFVTLAERWDGAKWVVQPAPNPIGGGILTGVSCTSATACTAVGYVHAAPARGTLAERWNGRKWVIEPTPNPTGYDALSGVSCTSATACAAVGYASTQHTSTLAERWNGSVWVVTHTPNLLGNHALSGVSCTSASACTAVGNATGTAFGVTLAERWNGRRWTVQPTPSPGRYTDDTLSGVSCTSAAACTAVGSVTSGQSTFQFTLAEAWNGRKWTVQPTSKPGQGQLMWLSGVSCPSAAACVGAGYNGAGAGVTLAEAWNGTAWASQRTPDPTGAQPSALSGISCPSAGACMAVGHATDQALIFGDVTMAERWNGSTWSVTPTPRVPGAITGYLGGSHLSAVACASAAACTAVGYYFAPNASSDYLAGLAERWNGKRWAVQPLPTSAEFSPLAGVSCPSATSCIAVGIYSTSSPYLVLAERWNGSRWTAVPAPSPAGDVTMGGVSCTSATACTLVGSYSSGDNQLTLAERWNGTTWTIQPTPNVPGSGGSYLTGVSCTSAQSCTAVGWAEGTKSGVVRTTLAEYWNGSTWTIQPTPNQPETVTQLNGVSCTSAMSCTAVGSFTNLLAEEWNGTTWTIHRLARPVGRRPAVLSDVSCVPDGPCTAVGNHSGTPWPERTLVERRS